MQNCNEHIIYLCSVSSKCRTLEVPQIHRKNYNDATKYIYYDAEHILILSGETIDENMFSQHGH